jgi:hypothetical protein
MDRGVYRARHGADGVKKRSPDFDTSGRVL